MTQTNREKLIALQPKLRKMASELESDENAKPDAGAQDSVPVQSQSSSNDQVLVKERYVTDREGRYLIFQGGRVSVLRWRTLSPMIQARILDWHAQGLEIEEAVQSLIASDAPLAIEEQAGTDFTTHSQPTNPGPR